MNFKDRIGVDLGQRNKIEDGLAAAVAHGIRYLDLKIDVAPNAIETLTPERIRGIRAVCDAHGIHVGIHTMSAVNVAEVAPHVRDGVDRYLFGHLEACSKLGGESDGGPCRLSLHLRCEDADGGGPRAAEAPVRARRGARRDAAAREHELGAGRRRGPLTSPTMSRRLSITSSASIHSRLRWAFTANHAHLVEEGVDGFLANMDIRRCDEVRLADCWRNGKEIHLLVHVRVGRMDPYASKRTTGTGGVQERNMMHSEGPNRIKSKVARGGVYLAVMAKSGQVGGCLYLY